MIKYLLLFFVIFNYVTPVFSETLLTGGVNYNVQSARDEMLQNPIKKVDTCEVAKNIKDTNNFDNLKYSLKGNVELKDRVLAFFSDSTYAVMYNNNKYYVWYYSKNGELIYIEKKDGVEYPYKAYKYTPSGKLVNMSLRPSREETFIYSPDGKLIAHWLRDKAFDEYGNVLMTRKYLE